MRKGITNLYGHLSLFFNSKKLQIWDAFVRTIFGYLSFNLITKFKSQNIEN